MIPFHFCPMCASPLTARRIPAPDGPERRVCSVCRFIQWGNSKPTASGIVVNDAGEILLARRGIEPFKGMWDVPGGFLEAAEHPEAGVVRELREETGLEVTVTRLVGIYMDTYGPEPCEDTLNVYYECRIVGGELSAADDITEAGWFDPDGLPGPLAFENARRAVDDYREQARKYRQQ
jgi:8-oxo-dGTP diphosphatase